MTPETRAHLWSYYTRENFPHHVADSGPWMICRNDRNYCAAIPRDPASGHLPSHYGTMTHVGQMARQGYITPVSDTTAAA